MRRRGLVDGDVKGRREQLNSLSGVQYDGLQRGENLGRDWLVSKPVSEHYRRGDIGLHIHLRRGPEETDLGDYCLSFESDSSASNKLKAHRWSGDDMHVAAGRHRGGNSEELMFVRSVEVLKNSHRGSVG